MKIDTDRIKALCKPRNLTIARLLRKAGVSHNAYYSLTRKSSVLPKSIAMLSRALNVRQSALLTDEDAEIRKARRLLKKVDEIVAENPGIDRDTVRHTLLLLQEKPIERLRRALVRGQAFDIRKI